MAKIKVMLVDDSAVVRQVDKETLAMEVDIEVVGAAARANMRRMHPS